jgi:hypothetical protein
MPKRILAIVASIVATSSFASVGAQASTLESGSGTFLNTLTPVASRMADGNTLVDFTLVETTTGFYAGTRVGRGSLVIHPDGTFTAHSSGVFTGTIAGRSGTAILSAQAEGTFAAGTGHAEVGDGTGGLAGVHCRLSITGAAVDPTTFAGTYTAQAQFGAP